MENKELELIVFAIEQDSGATTEKMKSRQLMDGIFENARTTTTQDDVDIDEIMNEMNNALS